MAKGAEIPQYVRPTVQHYWETSIDTMANVWLLLHRPRFAIWLAESITHAYEKVIPRDRFKIGVHEYFSSSAEQTLFQKVVEVRVAEAFMQDAAAERSLVEHLPPAQRWARRGELSNVDDMHGVANMYARSGLDEVNKLIHTASVQHRATVLRSTVNDAEALAAGYIRVLRAEGELNRKDRLPRPNVAHELQYAREDFAEMQQRILSSRVPQRFQKRVV